MDGNEENWKPVIGLEGEYEVSDRGRVRSLARTLTYIKCGVEVRRTHHATDLRPGRMKSGHMSVALGRGNSRCVHTLVLEAFVGPCPEGMEGLHADDNPAHNHLSNLRWGTRSENIIDAIDNGKMPIGSQKWNSKLDEKQVANIKANLLHLKDGAIAEMHGVSRTTITQIRDGRTWRHVGGCN